MITEWENIGAPAVQSLEETLKEMKDYETYLSALIKEVSLLSLTQGQKVRT
jgi:hypothetical protein